MAVMEIIEKTVSPKSGRVRLKLIETDIATSKKYITNFPAGLNYKTLKKGDNLTDYVLKDLEKDQEQDRTNLEKFCNIYDAFIDSKNFIPNLQKFRYEFKFRKWANKYIGQDTNMSIENASTATYKPLLHDIALSEVEIANFRNSAEDHMYGNTLKNIQEWSRHRPYLSTLKQAKIGFSYIKKFLFTSPSPYPTIDLDTHGLASSLKWISPPFKRQTSAADMHGTMVATIDDIYKKIPVGETATLRLANVTIAGVVTSTVTFNIKAEKINDTTQHSVVDAKYTYTSSYVHYGDYGILISGDPFLEKSDTNIANHFVYTKNPSVEPLRLNWLKNKTYL